MRYSGLRYLNNVILEININLPPSADAANNFNAEGLANPERIFKLYAASAERKCIFEHQNSMNPEVFCVFF